MTKLQFEADIEESNRKYQKIIKKLQTKLDEVNESRLESTFNSNKKFQL